MLLFVSPAREMCRAEEVHPAGSFEKNTLDRPQSK